MLNGGQIVAEGASNDVVEKYFEYNENNSKSGTKLYYHKAGSYFAKINNIDINNTKNPLLSLFDRISIKISIEVRDYIKAVELFIIIYNPEGLPVLSVFQKDNDELTRIEGATLEVSVNFDNSLIPGKYFVSAGMFDSSRQFVDWVEHAETFEIEHSYKDGRLFEPRLGMTVQKASWQIVK